MSIILMYTLYITVIQATSETEQTGTTPRYIFVIRLLKTINYYLFFVLLTNCIRWYNLGTIETDKCFVIYMLYKIEGNMFLILHPSGKG